MSNYQNIRYIVGNQFEEFSKGKDKVLVENELKALINNTPSELENSTLIFGQGCSERSKKSIIESINCNKINIVTPNKHIQIAENTHKHSKENSVVSIPRRLDSNNYASDLLIGTPAELDDHVTGQHIPGMLVIEASRQLLVAVYEKFFINQEVPKRDYYFVLHKLNSSFTDYVFPLPTKMYFEVKSFSDKNPNKLNTSCKISFFQMPGRFCCWLEYDISIVNTRIMSRLENNHANEVIQFVNKI